MSEQVDIQVTGAHLVRPGDYLILTTETRAITAEEAASIKEAVKRECPLLAGVVVAGKDWRLITIRPEAADE